MKRKHRHATIGVLISVIVSVCLLDAILYHVDPLGYSTYIFDWMKMIGISRPANHGFTFEPGEHHFMGYTAHINEQGYRDVPNSQGGDCTVGFIGDSFAFGLGVNDDENYVNLLAKDIPAETLNFGIPAYSSHNVAAQLQSIHADAYIWLIIWNDDDAMTKWSPPLPVYSALWVYMKNLGWDGGWHRAPNSARGIFTVHADLILDRDNILAFAFEGVHLTDIVKKRYPQVKIIPNYAPHWISVGDSHADAEGNRVIADAMRSDVLSFVNEQCFKEI